MRVNKYKGACGVCRALVLAKGGRLEHNGSRHVPVHLSCYERGGSAVDQFIIGGNEYIRNKAGRCIDAPCCGCCTI